MLSRLQRRADALDEACLRAQGYPRDHKAQQELLAALEWDATYHPEHAHPVIRDLFKQVHDHSTDLWHRLQSAAEESNAPAFRIDEINSLRQRLAQLREVLAARHGEPARPGLKIELD